MKFSFAFIRALKIYHSCDTIFKEKHGLEALLSFQEINGNSKNTFWTFQLKGHFLN